MSLQSATFLFPIVSLAFLVITHVIALRLLKDRGYIALYLIVALAGLATEIALDLGVALNSSSPMSTWLKTGLPNTVAYGALSYSYFHFYNLSETGRRIRVLIELLNSSNGLSESEILRIYNSNIVIDNRLDRLLTGDQIIEKDGKIYIGKKLMLRIAQLIMVFKRIVFGNKKTLVD